MSENPFTRWRALPQPARLRCAIEACTLSAAVWEAHTPPLGYTYFDGIGIEVVTRSSRSSCRTAVEIVAAHEPHWGADFAKHRECPVPHSVFTAMTYGELEVDEPSCWTLRVANSLFEAASLVGTLDRCDLSIDEDPLWLPINQAITAHSHDGGSIHVAPTRAPFDRQPSPRLRCTTLCKM